MAKMPEVITSERKSTDLEEKERMTTGKSSTIAVEDINGAPHKAEVPEPTDLINGFKFIRRFDRETLRLKDIMAFEQSPHSQWSMNTLLFIDILTGACCGRTIRSISERFHENWSDTYAESGVCRDNVLPVDTLLVDVWRLLHSSRGRGAIQEPIIAESIHEAIQRYREVYDQPCQRRNNVTTGRAVMAVAEALLNHSPRDVPLELLAPVMSLYLKNTHFILYDDNGHPRFAEWERWFEEFMEEHPVVARALDPHHVFVLQATPAALPDGTHANATALPVGGAVGLAAAPTRMPLGGVGPACPYVYDVANADDARAIALHLRAMHANPLGGAGGGAAAVYVARLATSAGGFRWV